MQPGRLVALLVFVAVLGVAPAAIAAEPATNSFDSIINLYRQNAAKWEATLANYALTLFWILVAIDLTLTGIRLAVKGAEFGEWASELVSQILFIGFFFALLKNAPVWASAIVNSFRTAASQAVVASGGTSLIAPSDVFSVGLALASKISDGASLYHPLSSIVMVLFALVLIVCFAIIAALLIVALVESYIVISAGVLFMGFGGSKLTKDFAVKILVYAVSVGAKLFVMQLLIGLGQQVFNALAANFETNSVDVFVVIGSAIVMLALTWFLPQLIQGMINGTAMGGNPAGVWRTYQNIGSATGGSLYAVYESGKLASEQIAEAQAAGRPASWVRAPALMAKNFVATSFETLGGRLGGRIRFGTFPGQIGEEMRQKALRMKDEREARQAQNPPPPGQVRPGRKRP
jgi:type IV secretion system protein TrbL